MHLANAGFKIAQRRASVFLETLAAAHAESADFDKALNLQRQAIEAAKALGDEQLQGELKKRIEGYLKKKPYREPSKEAGRPPKK